MYKCVPADDYAKCSDGPYKGLCVSRLQICDNFNVCGGKQSECGICYSVLLDCIGYVACRDALRRHRALVHRVLAEVLLTRRQHSLLYVCRCPVLAMTEASVRLLARDPASYKRP